MYMPESGIHSQKQEAIYRSTFSQVPYNVLLQRIEDGSVIIQELMTLLRERNDLDHKEVSYAAKVSRTNIYEYEIVDSSSEKMLGFYKNYHLFVSKAQQRLCKTLESLLDSIETMRVSRTSITSQKKAAVELNLREVSQCEEALKKAKKARAKAQIEYVRAQDKVRSLQQQQKQQAYKQPKEYTSAAMECPLGSSETASGTGSNTSTCNDTSSSEVVTSTSYSHPGVSTKRFSMGRMFSPFESTPAQELEKLEGKLMRRWQDLQTTEAAVQQKKALLLDKIASMDMIIQETAAAFQAVEYERLTVLQEFMHGFCEIEKTMIETRSNLIEQLEKAVEEHNPVQDVFSFIDRERSSLLTHKYSAALKLMEDMNREEDDDDADADDDGIANDGAGDGNAKEAEEEQEQALAKKSISMVIIGNAALGSATAVQDDEDRRRMNGQMKHSSSSNHDDDDDDDDDDDGNGDDGYDSNAKENQSTTWRDIADDSQAEISVVEGKKGPAAAAAINSSVDDADYRTRLDGSTTTTGRVLELDRTSSGGGSSRQSLQSLLSNVFPSSPLVFSTTGTATYTGTATATLDASVANKASPRELSAAGDEGEPTLGTGLATVVSQPLLLVTQDMWLHALGIRNTVQHVYDRNSNNNNNNNNSSSSSSSSSNEQTSANSVAAINKQKDYFLQELDTQRGRRCRLASVCGYTSLLNGMKVLLDYCEATNDAKSAMRLSNMANTFYITASLIAPEMIGTLERRYLQSEELLNQHIIWRKTGFWEQALRDCTLAAMKDSMILMTRNTAAAVSSEASNEVSAPRASNNSSSSSSSSSSYRLPGMDTLQSTREKLSDQTCVTVTASTSSSTTHSRYGVQQGGITKFVCWHDLSSDELREAVVHIHNVIFGQLGMLAFSMQEAGLCTDEVLDNIISMSRAYQLNEEQVQDLIQSVPQQQQQQQQQHSTVPPISAEDSGAAEDASVPSAFTTGTNRPSGHSSTERKGKQANAGMVSSSLVLQEQQLVESRLQAPVATQIPISSNDRLDNRTVSASSGADLAINSGSLQNIEDTTATTAAAAACDGVSSRGGVGAFETAEYEDDGEGDSRNNSAATGSIGRRQRRSISSGSISSTGRLRSISSSHPSPTALKLLNMLGGTKDAESGSKNDEGDDDLFAVL